MHNKCWIANRLAQGSLPHPASCPHCDQANENINHLLISYVFVWQLWYNLLQNVVLKSLLSFDSWWSNVEVLMDGRATKGLNSLIILGSQTIWKHHNRLVFDGVSPNLANALLLARLDLYCWHLAGPRGISFFLVLGPEVGS
jgi:hypothetical protein